MYIDVIEDMYVIVTG